MHIAACHARRMVHATPPSMATRPAPLRVVLHALLIVASMAFGVWVLYRLASVALVVILAAMFAYVIAPLVHFARRPISWQAGRAVCREGRRSPRSICSSPGVCPGASRS